MGKLKNAVFPLVAGGILIATAIVGGVTAANQNTSLDSQKAQLSRLDSKIAAAQATTSKLESTSSLASAGAQGSRVTSDTANIEDLVHRVFTWNSDATYREARASTMRITGLSEDSSFMTAFLPKAPVNVDKQGNQYPYIDAAGLNSEVADTTVKLLSVDALNYNYLALVDVQAKSSDGLGTAGSVATILITINGENKVTALTGFASTTQPRVSG
ncbi:hypothetical protein ACFVU2_19890 [Leifsonia sp. NPDC058194]|uniref:hypothetical protein n=1 Tax=Leifsonia sp. NPDC058194 TaxID=3346374 RepID=UPI0036DAE072